MKTSRRTASEIGPRQARLKLSRNVTQSILAKDAGIGLRTLRRLEAEKPSSMRFRTDKSARSSASRVPGPNVVAHDRNLIQNRKA